MQDSKWAYSLVPTFEQSQFDRKMPEATVLPFCPICKIVRIWSTKWSSTAPHSPPNPQLWTKCSLNFDWQSLSKITIRVCCSHCTNRPRQVSKLRILKALHIKSQQFFRQLQVSIWFIQSDLADILQTWQVESPIGSGSRAPPHLPTLDLDHLHPLQWSLRWSNWIP